MTNAERSEVFALIPRSETGDGSIAFVLPDLFPNPKSIVLRERDRVNGLWATGKACDEGNGSEKVSLEVLLTALFS
jgi:hypothetical protein